MIQTSPSTPTPASGGDDPLDDLQLVRRSVSGSSAAYAELVRRYQARLYQTIYAMVGDPDDADDLAQETFVNAYRSLRTFRGESTFSTWLYRIALNQSMDWLKAKRRRFNALRAYSSSDYPACAVEADSGVFRRELSEHLEAALERLAPEQRAVLVMREIDGRTHGEIAGLLGCSPGTVKSRLFRARTHIRDLLTADYADLNGQSTYADLRRAG